MWKNQTRLPPCSWAGIVILAIGLGQAGCYGGYPELTPHAEKPSATPAPNVGVERGTPLQSYRQAWDTLCVSLFESGLVATDGTVTEKDHAKLAEWIERNVVNQRANAFLEMAFNSDPDERALQLTDEMEQLGFRRCAFVQYILLIDCASEHKSAKACYRLGVVALKNNRQPEAHRLFQLALGMFSERCDAQGGESCAILGMMYKLGHGTEKSNEEATRFFPKACESGDSRGCKALKLYND